MNRKELISSDEYVTETIDCIVVSGKGVKQTRAELCKCLLDLQKELIEVYSKQECTCNYYGRCPIHSIGNRTPLTQEGEDIRKELTEIIKDVLATKGATEKEYPFDDSPVVRSEHKRVLREYLSKVVNEIMKLFSTLPSAAENKWDKLNKVFDAALESMTPEQWQQIEAKYQARNKKEGIDKEEETEPVKPMCINGVSPGLCQSIREDMKMKDCECLIYEQKLKKWKTNQKKRIQ